MGCESEWDCASVAVLSISPEYRFVTVCVRSGCFRFRNRWTGTLALHSPRVPFERRGDHPIRLHRNELARISLSFNHRFLSRIALASVFEAQVQNQICGFGILMAALVRHETEGSTSSPRTALLITSADLCKNGVQC